MPAVAAPAAAALVAVAILPFLADGTVSVKQAHGVTALVRKAVSDGKFAKLLKETKGDDADAQKCQRAPECLGKIGDVRGADLVVAGAVKPVEGGLALSLFVVDAHGQLVRHAETTLQGNDGDDARVDRVARSAVDPTALRGSITVTGDEGAAITLDGAPIGTLPLDGEAAQRLRDLVEGEHVIVAKKDGYQPFERSVSVVHRQTAEVRAVLLDDTARAPLKVQSRLDDGTPGGAAAGPASHTDAIVVGSVGAGLAVLGLAAGALALKDTLDVEARAKAQQLTFPENSDLYQRGQILAYTADGLYAAAVVAGAAAAVLWFTEGP